MAHDQSSHAEGDFTNVPPPLSPRTMDERLTAEIPEREQAGQPLVPGVAGFEVRKKNSLFDWLQRPLPSALIPVALAGVSWLLGGNVAGGKVHGDWTGLEDGQLHEGRDLPVTTDYRIVLAHVCERHLKLPD